MSQTTGLVRGGTEVTITGTDLDNVTAVDVGQNPAAITSDSATQIVVNSPAGSLGTVNVTVTTTDGTSATSMADQFTYISPPTITSLTTPAGPANGGSTVYIYGLDLGGAMAVNFGQTAGTIVSNGGTFLVATSPAAAAGTVDVTITTPNGTTAVSTADKFTYVAVPVVNSVGATGGPAVGGTSVIITGKA